MLTAGDTEFLSGTGSSLPPSAPVGSTGGPFEIDGNLVVNGATPARDWASISGLNVGLDLPTGQQDNSFGQGSKENTAVPSVVTGSIPNNKSDLTRFYVASQVLNDEAHLYLAWDRRLGLGRRFFLGLPLSEQEDVRSRDQSQEDEEGCSATHGRVLQSACQRQKGKCELAVGTWCPESPRLLGVL